MDSQNRTMTEAKDWLRVSQPTLYRLINENKLKTYKVGRRRYTTIKALENCIKALESEPLLPREWRTEKEPESEAYL